jgi:hypothetical protein
MHLFFETGDLVSIDLPKCSSISGIMQANAPLIRADATLGEIANCTNLTHLNLNGYHQMSLETLSSILEKCKFVETLNLRYLNLVINLNSKSGCPRMNDVAMDSISTNLPDLKSLSLRGCYEMSSTGHFQLHLFLNSSKDWNASQSA